MISEPYAGEIRGRWEAVRDIAIEIATGPDGHAKILVCHDASQAELRVTRDGDPAGDGDVLFVGHAFSDIPRLLDALESGNPLPAEDATEIGMRIASASPGPWMVFLESDGGMGGDRVIVVSESDNEADIYLWLGPDLAPSAIFLFVAEATSGPSSCCPLSALPGVGGAGLLGGGTRRGEAAGFVAQQHGFDEGEDGGFLVVVEAADGFQAQGEVVAGGRGVRRSRTGAHPR